MSRQGGIAFVAVDWGTSRLRVWTIDPDGTVLDERKSNEGMSTTGRDRFEGILESHLTAMAVPEDVPVIMCGMVGSRQGWAEAGYLPVPASLDRVAEEAVQVPSRCRDIRILPGLSKPDPARPDVMRGEETQLLGLAGISSAVPETAGIICMPGTHSKWVRQSGLYVEDFASFMTGDLFAALSVSSVLRHSIGSASVEPGSADFRNAVQGSLDEPADILARLFSIRPAGLLHGLSAAAARARLSGYLIGQEIAGARSRFSVGPKIELVGGGVLGELYREALSVAGIGCNDRDGNDLAIAGLTRAASIIW